MDNQIQRAARNDAVLPLFAWAENVEFVRSTFMYAGMDDATKVFHVPQAALFELMDQDAAEGMWHRTIASLLLRATY